MNDTQGQEYHIYSNTHLKALQFTLGGGHLLQKFLDLGVSLFVEFTYCNFQRNWMSSLLCHIVIMSPA